MDDRQQTKASADARRALVQDPVVLSEESASGSVRGAWVPPVAVGALTAFGLFLAARAWRAR